MLWLTCHPQRWFTCQRLVWLYLNEPLYLLCLTHTVSISLLLLLAFIRLTWPEKTCPMESPSTCAAWERGTGLERKHYKGEIVLSGAASSNLNPGLSCCFPVTVTRSSPNFYWQCVFNIHPLTPHLRLSFLICRQSPASSYLFLFSPLYSLTHSLSRGSITR